MNNTQKEFKKKGAAADAAAAALAGVSFGPAAAQQVRAASAAPAAQFTDAQRVAAAAAANPAGSPRGSPGPRAPFEPRAFNGPLNPASQRRVDAWGQRPAAVAPTAPIAGGMGAQPIAAAPVAAAAAPRPAPEPGKMNYVKDLLGRGADRVRNMRPAASATTGAPPPGMAAGAPNFGQQMRNIMPFAGPGAQKAAVNAAKGGVAVVKGGAGVLGAIARPAMAIDELDEIRQSIVDPKAGSGDVALQAASSGGTLAATAAGAVGGAKVGAGIGAAAGAFFPPALPVTTAVGGVVGGVVGGGLGYYAADTLVGTGREGIVTKGINALVRNESPADRARSAAAEQMRGAKGPAAMPTAQAPATQAPATQAPVAVAAAPAAQAPPAAPAEYGKDWGTGYIVNDRTGVRTNIGERIAGVGLGAAQTQPLANQAPVGRAQQYNDAADALMSRQGGGIGEAFVASGLRKRADTAAGQEMKVRELDSADRRLQIDDRKTDVAERVGLVKARGDAAKEQREIERNARLDAQAKTNADRNYGLSDKAAELAASKDTAANNLAQIQAQSMGPDGKLDPEKFRRGLNYYNASLQQNGQTLGTADPQTMLQTRLGNERAENPDAVPLFNSIRSAFGAGANRPSSLADSQITDVRNGLGGKEVLQNGAWIPLKRITGAGMFGGNADTGQLQAVEQSLRLRGKSLY